MYKSAATSEEQWERINSLRNFTSYLKYNNIFLENPIDIYIVDIAGSISGRTNYGIKVLSDTVYFSKMRDIDFEDAYGILLLCQ